MPDDRNIFDDDFGDENLTPGWLHNSGDQPEDAADAPESGRQARPPWETQPGPEPSAPNAQALTPPPWELSEGPPAPPPTPSTARPPWVAGSGQALSPDADRAWSDEGLPSWDNDFDDEMFDAAATEFVPSAPAEAGDVSGADDAPETTPLASDWPDEERLRGYTDDLPWPEDTDEAPAPDVEAMAGLPPDRITMSSLASEFGPGDDDAFDADERPSEHAPQKPQASILNRLSGDRGEAPDERGDKQAPEPPGVGEAGPLPEMEDDLDWLAGFDAEDEGSLRDQRDQDDDQHDAQHDEEPAGEAPAEEPVVEAAETRPVPPLDFPTEESEEPLDLSWLDEVEAPADLVPDDAFAALLDEADDQAAGAPDETPGDELPLPEPDLSDLTGDLGLDADAGAERPADEPGEPLGFDMPPDIDDFMSAQMADLGGGAEEWADEPAPPETAAAGWLDDTSEPSAESAVEPPEAEDVIGEEHAPDWVRPAAEERPRGIRRIAPDTGEPSEVEAGPVEEPEWMAEAAALDLPEEHPLSYDEWEQQELARQQEEQKTDDDRLLEEVPDWFKQMDEGAAPPTEPAAEAPDQPEAQGPEFVPGWFLGLEEQDAEEAPDWFQKLDYTPDAITRPPESSDEPLAPAASEEDLPDWFKGVEGPDLPGEADQPEAPTPADRMPDTGALLGQGAVREREEPLMTAPEDIPFPDLDLDQAMPGDTEDEDGDFIERFEPLTFDETPSMPAQLDPDAPDWLREVEAGAPPDEAESVPADVFGVPPGAAGESLPEPDAVADADSLDWLDDLSPADVSEAAAGEPSSEFPSAEDFDSDEIDRLLSLYEPAPDLPEPAPPAEEAGDEALEAVEDSWDELEAALPPVEPIEGVPMPEPAPPAAEQFAADRDADEGAEAPPAEAPEAPIVPAADAEDLFAALEKELSQLPADDEGAPSDAAASVDLAEGQQPEWVQDLRPSDVPVKLRAGGVELDMQERTEDQLPERLRHFRALARDRLRREPEAESAPLDSGPLAGVAGALPLVDALQPESRRAVVEGPVVTRQQQARAERLQALLDSAADEQPAGGLEPDFLAEEPADADVVLDTAPVAKPRRRVRFKLDRLLLTLVLLAALVVPFVTDAVHFGDDPAALTGSRAAVAREVAQVGPGDYVLFAFEYGPPAAGALDPLATSVLRHVLAQNAIPLTISTDPAGALHASAVIRALGQDAALLAARDQDEGALVADEDYVTLSYLPGEMVGVRTLRDPAPADDDQANVHPAFDTNLRGEATGLLVDDVAQDVALVVVIGDTTEDVRVWAEQLEGADVVRVALVTAAVEPLVTAYVHADGYAGYLSGLRDSYSYNAAHNAGSMAPYELPEDLPIDLPLPETARWHSMALGAAVAAALIGLGVVINLVRMLGRRRRR